MKIIKIILFILLNILFFGIPLLIWLLIKIIKKIGTVQPDDIASLLNITPRKMKIINKILFILFSWILIPLGIIYALYLGIMNNGNKCVWCGSENGLTFLEGVFGDSIWEYRNVDGSRDKRSIENFQTKNFLSSYECNSCKAINFFKHEYAKDPSRSTRVYEGTLGTGGNGGRIAKDFRTGYVEPDKDSENRKNS